MKKMTKSLTEQWKDGELECGYYYIKARSWEYDDKWHIKKKIEIDYYDEDEWSSYEDCDIYCVVAPVPTYNEYNKLKERLKEAECR